MNEEDNILCHCNDNDKIRLKDFDLKLLCCRCKYQINCCNINETLSPLVKNENCTICEEQLTEYDIERCKLYLNIYDLIISSNSFDNFNYFSQGYNNQYIKMYDISFSFCFNIAELDFITIHKLTCNEIIDKFIDKNIYIWFRENFKYFKNIYQ